jgi:hypothetical protein
MKTLTEQNLFPYFIRQGLGSQPLPQLETGIVKKEKMTSFLKSESGQGLAQLCLSGA